MLHYAVAFMVIALIAALFGAAGLAGAVAIAQPVFLVCVLMAVVSLAIGLTRRT